MPAPNDPISLAVLKNLRDTLQAISTASGYHTTVPAGAVKFDIDQDVESLVDPDGPRPFVLIEVLAESREYFPAGEVRCVYPVKVHWVTDATDDSDDAKLTLFCQGAADIEKAIAVDPSRGGVASDTRIVRSLYDSSVEGLRVWGTTEITISVRRTYGQPNT